MLLKSTVHLGLGVGFCPVFLFHVLKLVYHKKRQIFFGIYPDIQTLPSLVLICG